ncbi:MAG: nitrate/nitrite transporter NrtS [Phormidesmis sp.]
MRTPKQIIKQILFTIRQPRCRKTAFRVALVVGTVLFSINHGSALLSHEMNRDRWLAAVFTYCVPFMVSIHGQSMARRRAV